MPVRKTTLMRVDSELADQLRWLTEHEKAAAARAGRKPRSASHILKHLAGRRVNAAFAKIAPWVKTVRAAMDSDPAAKRV